MGSNEASMADIPTVIFVFWPTLALAKVLVRRQIVHDAKSTYPAKDLNLFNSCKHSKI
jgi:hypothetical protein